MSAEAVVLSALTEHERYERFDDLQSRMAGVWDALEEGPLPG